MSRAGDEMVAALAGLLNKHDVSLDKTAAKKEDKEEKKDEKKEEKADKKEEKAEKKDEKKDKKEEKKDKKKKKADVMSEVLNNLVKLAEELDAAGAGEAANLVDDALRIIVKNIKADEKKN